MALQTAEYLVDREFDSDESFNIAGRSSKSMRGLVIAGLLAIVSLFIFIVVSQSGLLEPANVNRMLLGAESTITVNYPLKLRSAVELDGKTASEILEMRNRAVKRHAQLIAEEYEPSVAFRGLPESGSEWLGTLGKFGHPTGRNATDGPAQASRVLLNPLLLVSADIWPVNTSLKRVKMSPDGFRPSEMRDYHEGNRPLPFFCEPVGLVWEPQQHKATVTYDVGHFLAERRKMDKSQVTLATIAEIDFNCFNARDLNFNHCYTSPRFAKNINMVNGSGHPFALNDRIDSNQQCLDAESSFYESMFQLTGSFPASVEFLFWENKPGAGTVPDLRFTVRFENTLAASPSARKWIEYFRGSQDALCTAGVALAEVAADQNDLAARDRAITASQRLETLAQMQKALPQLDSPLSKEVNKYVTGNEMKLGYSIFSRASNVIPRLKNVDGYQSLVAEFNKPHWRALHTIR